MVTPVVNLPEAAFVRRWQSSFSPPIRLQRMQTRSATVWVAREDLLPGGTKQRAALPFVANKANEGFRSFVYASPFAGFAQVALAVACDAIGVQCVLHCERDPSTGDAHEFTELARMRGARIELHDDLASAEAAGLEHGDGSGIYKVPLGFDCADYRRIYGHELARLWPSVVRRLGGPPEQLWVALGSGTLSSVLRDVVGEKLKLRCIDVGVLPADDARVRRVMALPNTVVRRVPERFAEPASYPPAIPSNRHYDAKLWRFVEEHAGPNDLWWNVAR